VVMVTQAIATAIEHFNQLRVPSLAGRYSPGSDMRRKAREELLSLHRLHHAQHITAENLVDIALRITAAQQLAR